MRFNIVTEDENFKWKLPKGMTNYANKHFEEFIADGVLKEAISMQIPMSENMDTVNILEDFLKDFLREKRPLASSLCE